MSIESVMPSSHLILCRPLLLLPSTPPSIRVFSNESTLRMRWPKYWSSSFSLSPCNEHPGLICFRMDWLDLLAVEGTLKSLDLYKFERLILQVNVLDYDSLRSFQPFRYISTYQLNRKKSSYKKWYLITAVTQSCLTLTDPMDCSTPGFPVHYQLPEFAQTHVHWISDAIQPSHPLLFPSPPIFNPSQHQGLFH